MKEKNLNVLHIILIIIGTIFISLAIFHQNLWFDEAYSVAIANHSFSEIWQIGGADVHPVLYYFLLRIINVLANGNLICYRLFSVLPITILGILGFTHIKKDFGSKIGITFTFLTFFASATAIYANQIRMYSWCLLNVAVLAIYAYRIYSGDKTSKNIIIFSLFNLFSMYTHYYGLMAAGVIDLLILFNTLHNKDYKLLKKLIIIYVLLIILYIPWLTNFISQLKYVSSDDGFWIKFKFPYTYVELSSYQFLGYYVDSLTKEYGWYQYLVCIITTILTIYMILRVIKDKNKMPLISLCIYFIVVVAALIITLFLGTPILYHRYMFILLSFYIFPLSYILALEKNNIIKYGIIFFVLVTSIINVIGLIMENYNQNNKEVINYIKDNINNEDILFGNDLTGTIIKYYFKGNNNKFLYNGYNWKINKAYEAFGPNLFIYNDTSFIDKLNDEFIIVGYDDFIYNELFNNDNYIKISDVEFDFNYQNLSHYRFIKVKRISK